MKKFVFFLGELAQQGRVTWILVDRRDPAIQLRGGDDGTMLSYQQRKIEHKGEGEQRGFLKR